MSDLLASLKEILEAAEKNENWTTVNEMKDALGLSKMKVRGMLKTLHSANKLECKYVYRLAISGKMMLIPAYRLKKETKEKKA
jgi:response regulator of citrate/malate metabolism